MHTSYKNSTLIFLVFCAFCFCKPLLAQNTKEAGKGTTSEPLPTECCACIAGLSGDIQISKPKLLATVGLTTCGCNYAATVIRFQIVLMVNGRLRLFNSSSGLFTDEMKSLFKAMMVGSHIIIQNVAVKTQLNGAKIIPGINVEVVKE